MSVSRAGNDTTSPPGPASHVRDDDYDALAELFLGAPEDGPQLRLSSDPEHETPAQSTPVGTAVEALVLGHLPVLSGPWVAQYARFLADTTGQSVALLRIYADQASIDLFSEREAGGVNPSDTLESAIARMSPVADRWVIRVDPTSEPILATNRAVDRVTLLCGADDAAVVAAYQTIKRLHTESAEQVDAIDATAPEDARYRVVIIGASADRARAASEKIRRAASAFLSLDVHVDAGPTQVGPTRGLTIYRGLAPDDLERFAARISGDSSAPVTTPPPPAPEAQATTEPVLSHDMPTDAFSRQGPNPADPVPAAGSGLLGDTGALVQHVGGLVAIDIQCPYAGDIEFAADAQGSLHLLAHHTVNACQTLEVVAAWARDHAPLLERLDQRLRLDSVPTRHIFTSDAAGARRLLDSDVRVHILAPVVVEGKQGWFSTPLNG